MRWQDVERSLVKSTSKKLAPLKPKHIQVITAATWQREVEISDMFRVISSALRSKDNNWVIVFKGLIVTHIMLREGNSERVNSFLCRSSGSLNIGGFRDKNSNSWGIFYQLKSYHLHSCFQEQTQTKNIRAYATYIEERVTTFKDLGEIDLVTSKEEMIARIRSAPLKRELLLNVQTLQKLINALLDCSFYHEEIDNVITLQAFRLLIADMLALFHLLNEGVIRILGGYFEMQKGDATLALHIYKQFAQQTTKTVNFFDLARRLQSVLGVQIPDLKHAPVSLGDALEIFLKSPDFEEQREAYLEKKKNKGSSSQNEQEHSPVKMENEVTKLVQPSANQIRKEMPVIDFFSSLDQEINSLSSVSQYAAAANNTIAPFGVWSNNADLTMNPFLLQQQQAQILQMQQVQLQQQQNQLLQQQQLTGFQPFSNSNVLDQQFQQMGLVSDSSQTTASTLQNPFNFQPVSLIPAQNSSLNNPFSIGSNLINGNIQQSTYTNSQSSPKTVNNLDFTVDNVFGSQPNQNSMNFTQTQILNQPQRSFTFPSTFDPLKPSTFSSPLLEPQRVSTFPSIPTVQNQIPLNPMSASNYVFDPFAPVQNQSPQLQTAYLPTNVMSSTTNSQVNFNPFTNAGSIQQPEGIQQQTSFKVNPFAS
ncbi:hypothetical protein HK096_008814 [Nowakowskiella sp. JEL0078]|nr:hypothetical protein HK096_008814 [Nowakowskiella sp. JEL0078]